LTHLPHGTNSDATFWKFTQHFRIFRSIDVGLSRRQRVRFKQRSATFTSAENATFLPSCQSCVCQSVSGITQNAVYEFRWIFCSGWMTWD